MQSIIPQFDLYDVKQVGTLVSAAIRPNDYRDPIATAYSNEIKGGAHGYATFDEMLTIPIARRQWGMLVTIYNDGDGIVPLTTNNATYQLKYGYSSTDLLDNANWVKTSIGENISTEWVDSVISILEIGIEPNYPAVIGDRYLLSTIPLIFPSTSAPSPSAPSPSVPSISVWDIATATVIIEYDPNSVDYWNITYPTNGMTVRVDNDNNSMYKYEGVYPTGEWKKEKITQVFYIEPTSISGVTYSVSTNPIFNSYSKDLIFLTKFSTPNIGTASLNINALGYKNIKIATKNGVRDLIATDITTNGIYSLTYNGTYFQMTIPFPSDAHNIEYYISPGEIVTVKEYEQYWVYGDLTVEGSIVNYGQVVVANGVVNLVNGGSFNNIAAGELILVDLFNTPTFNTSSTIQLSSEMTINGPSVSATLINNSLTTDLLNTINTATASWILSNDGNGSFQWVLPTSGGLDINSDLFYNLGTTVSATNSTSAIYRTGSINIGTGTGSNSRFVVSSSGGTTSFVVDEFGNIYNGHDGMFSSLTNLKFGYGALLNNISGPVNLAIGYNALLNNDGSDNLAIGVEALLNNISGSANLAIGAGSLYSNTIGDCNLAIGESSLEYNTSGIENVAVGSISLINNTIGSYNTVVGFNAFASNTVGNYNIALGHQAGPGNATYSSNSIYIGYQAGIYSGNYDNQIIIGSTVSYGANSVILGNNAITKTILTGNVGIGTASASTKLHIYATQSGAFRLQDGTQGAGYVLTSDANGVGTWTMSSVRSYVTILSQSGTASPTEIAVVNNTLGVTLTWSYLSVGQYRLTSSSPIFDLNKMWWSSYVGASNGETLSGGPVNSTTFDVICRVSGAFADSYLSGAPFKIEVYN